MSLVTLAQEIANDRTDVRASSWAEYQDQGEAALAAMFPDLSNAQHISELGQAIVHYMVALYYESDSVDDIHISQAQHHWSKYNALTREYQPSDAILDALYSADAATAISNRFPDFAGTLATTFEAAVRFFTLGRFYGRNGEDADANKSSYYMGLFQREIAGYQPVSGDLAAFETEASSVLAARFPDVTSPQTKLPSAVKYYALARFYGKNGEDADANKSAHYMSLFEKEIAGYQPVSGDLAGFETEAKATIAKRFPDMDDTTILTRFPGAVNHYCKAKFYGANGTDSDAGKSSYYMGLFEKEIAKFEPEESDYSSFVDEGEADLLARRPYLSTSDITAASYVEAVSYYARAKWFERNGGDEGHNIASNLYRMYREQT